MRAGVVAVVIAIGVGIGGGAITASRGTTSVQEAPATAAATASAPKSAPSAPSVPTAAPTQAPVAAAAITPAAVAATVPAAVSVVAGPVPSPIIPRGTTEFEGDIIAERTGNSVEVDFDTDLLRTRRADKFETVVRETLPAMYGSRGDSLLAGVPIGQLTREGALLTELPRRGIHLPAHKGWGMTLWPLTREGRDGPIVIGYRTAVAKAQ